MKLERELESNSHELEIIEKDHDPSLTVNLHKFITEFKSDEVEILTYKFKFTSNASNLYLLHAENKNIEDLTPKEILLKKLETEDIEEDKKNLINTIGIRFFE